MTIGFIGVGKMASAIIKGIQKTGHDIIISGSSPDHSEAIARELGVTAAKSHQTLIDEADIIILGIKPQMFEKVLSDLIITKPILSMAAGITLQQLADLTDPSLALIRIMPNMNAKIGQSTTGICFNPQVSEALKALAYQITDSFGSTFELTEKDFDAFTALAGSGPAYIALFIEALAKAGVKNGLTKAQALEMVNQTVLATANNLLNTKESPHDLIDQVCSPGGTTIAGLTDLEKTGLTHSVISAIDTTIDKAQSMTKRG